MQNSVRTLHLGRHWVLQQDNNLKQTSKKVLQYFKDTNTNVVEWLAQSPDLNPIEPCGKFGKRTSMLEKHANMAQLKHFAMKEWAKIPQ